jgi:hypothetical protein
MRTSCRNYLIDVIILIFYFSAQIERYLLRKDQVLPADSHEPAGQGGEEVFAFLAGTASSF